MRTKQPITFWTMLVGAVVAVALGGWLTLTLWPGNTDEVPSAQAAVADACANASELNHFDAVITAYDEDGSQTGLRVEMTVNRTGYRELNYFGGILESEIVRTYTADDSDAGRSDTQARSYNITQYHRPAGESWEVSELTHETAGSGPEFCGYAADSFNTMRSVGSTTLNGESATQYEGTIDLAGERWDATWQFWVNSEGRLVQLKVTRLGVGIQTNYSGFNEVNVIAAPLESANNNDVATEEPTAEPTEAATAEPTEAATAEPTTEPTEPPTAEPELVQTAWLEPDPSGMTIGDDWEMFTLRGTGVERLQVQYNFRNASGSTSSTGGVDMASGATQSQASACEFWGFGGRDRSVDGSFHFIGCQDGVTIIRLKHGEDVLTTYTVRVDVSN